MKTFFSGLNRVFRGVSPPRGENRAISLWYLCSGSEQLPCQFWGRPSEGSSALRLITSICPNPSSSGLASNACCFSASSRSFAGALPGAAESSFSSPAICSSQRGPFGYSPGCDAVKSSTARRSAVMSAACFSGAAKTGIRNADMPHRNAGRNNRPTMPIKTERKDKTRFIGVLRHAFPTPFRSPDQHDNGGIPRIAKKLRQGCRILFGVYWRRVVSFPS